MKQATSYPEIKEITIDCLRALQTQIINSRKTFEHYDFSDLTEKQKKVLIFRVEEYLFLCSLSYGFAEKFLDDLKEIVGEENES